jgi:hypothetical protein
MTVHNNWQSMHAQAMAQRGIVANFRIRDWKNTGKPGTLDLFF